MNANDNNQTSKTSLGNSKTTRTDRGASGDKPF